MRGRRRQRAMGMGFDLFPFLSILACVLGCLLLVVMVTVALSVGPGAAQIIEIEGTSDKTPVVIEWDGTSVVLHPEKLRVSAAAALAKDGRNDSPFGKLLDRLVAKKKESYVFVLVRPSGFDNFDAIRAAVVRRELDIGYEPVEQHRVIGVAEGR